VGINHIDVIGNLVRNPEMRYTPNGVPTTQFTLAVKRPPREGSKGESIDYIPVITWRKLAETSAESFKKGDLVSVEGRMLTRTYETSDGQRRKVVEIEALAVEPIRVEAGTSQPPEDVVPEILEENENIDEIPF
jgi:single-strand DNA-binding protein